MRASNKQTSECGMDRNSTEELIKQLENRLARLTGQPAEDMNEEEIENLKEETPLGKIGDPKDIAKCVKWLIEDEFTTGQIISINGGWIIT